MVWWIKIANSKDLLPIFYEEKSKWVISPYKTLEQFLNLFVFQGLQNININVCRKVTIQNIYKPVIILKPKRVILHNTTRIFKSVLRILWHRITFTLNSASLAAFKGIQIYICGEFSNLLLSSMVFHIQSINMKNI